nr:zinc finger protein 853-like isoform X2 [Nomia melanderi]
MVYESDFYTTRRPYTRPYVSSYSVTTRPITLPLSTILQYFDDEAREIRAKVDSLLRRVHVFVPRAVASDFLEEIVPERMRSGDYVRRLLSGKSIAKKDPEPVSWYEVPERGDFGTLACVKYVAGNPQSIRRPYYKVADLRPSDIKNDVNFLSYYKKNRQAAANALKQDKEEAIKKIEQYLVKAAEQARSDEERKQAAEEERVQLELEEVKAWEALQVAQERAEHINEILDQEKAQAERQAEEAKMEADRLEAERIREVERQLEQARLTALMEEEERMIVEEHLEKVRVQEEEEERLANVAIDDTDEVKDVDCSRDDVVESEVTDQEKEERPFVLIAEDETKIEEESVQEDDHPELPDDPFVEEPVGAESKAHTGENAVEDTPNADDVASGGEEVFEWGDEDA